MASRTAGEGRRALADPVLLGTLAVLWLLLAPPLPSLAALLPSALAQALPLALAP